MNILLRAVRVGRIRRLVLKHRNVRADRNVIPRVDYQHRCSESITVTAAEIHLLPSSDHWATARRSRPCLPALRPSYPSPR